MRCRVPELVWVRVRARTPMSSFLAWNVSTVPRMKWAETAVCFFLFLQPLFQQYNYNENKNS